MRSVVRFKDINPQPLMSDLLSNRVQQCISFANVRMNYGRPFIVKESQRINARTHKAYLSLFIYIYDGQGSTSRVSGRSLDRIHFSIV